MKLFPVSSKKEFYSKNDIFDRETTNIWKPHKHAYLYNIKSLLNLI